MELRHFENKLQHLRARNGWKIVLEFTGIYSIFVYDKETDELLGCTGATSLEGVLMVLKIPFTNVIWGKPK